MAEAAKDVEHPGDAEAIPEEKITHDKDTYRLNQIISPSSSTTKNKCSVEFQCYEGGYWMANCENMETILADICSDDPVWGDFDVVVDPKIDPRRLVKITMPCLFLPFALGGKFDMHVSDKSGPNIRLHRISEPAVYFRRKPVYVDTGVSNVPSMTISFATEETVGVGRWDQLIRALVELPNLRRTHLHLPQNELLSVEAILAKSKMAILDVQGCGAYRPTSASFWNQLAAKGHDNKRKRDIGTPCPVLLGNVCSVTFSYLQLPHDGWLALCKWIQVSKSIKDITTQSCRIESEDGSAGDANICPWDPLVDVIKHNQELRSVFLSLKFDDVTPNLTPECTNRVYCALCHNCNLTHINLPQLPLPPSFHIRLNMNQCRLSSLALLVSSSPSRNEMTRPSSVRRTVGKALADASEWYAPELQPPLYGPATPQPALDCLFALFQDCPHLIQVMPSEGWGN